MHARSPRHPRRLAPRIATALALALLLGSALAERDVRDLDLRGIVRVEARTTNGTITVRVDPSATGVTVDHRGNVAYDVRVDGDRLVVEGRNRSLLCLDCEVSLEVRLAAPADLELRTTNGNVRVEGAMLRVAADSTNGNVSTRATADAPLRLGTTNGRIEIDDAVASVEARTNNGSIEVRGLTLPAGADATLRSVNGSVTVAGLRSDAALLVSGHLSNGGITVDLPGYEVRTPDRRSFEARGSGAGSASLRLQTVNGSLSVRD